MFNASVAATVREVDRFGREDDREIFFHPRLRRARRCRPHIQAESRSSSSTELLITDGADRLKARGIEQVKDYYDRNAMGLILIGMPGIERRLARYPGSTCAHRTRPRCSGRSAPPLPR
jgi:DNA transposition AAA+ family ATPase